MYTRGALSQAVRKMKVIDKQLKTAVALWQFRCLRRGMWEHLAALLCRLSLICLADNTIVGTGLGRNSGLAIAPGQFLRLDVRGIGASLTGKVAASVIH